MAWEQKLFCSLVVTDRMLWYLLPNGREDKSLCEGVGGVFHNAGCLTRTACGVNV